MTDTEKSTNNNFLNKLYGGINMSWRTVIIYAVVTAIITALFLILPIFKNTSFERMGVNFEAWIFFAIIIMANCEKPLDSALKTFVFFLISQPLIFLLQVPFNELGFGIFNYYSYWFILTLLTFPAAYIGWYIKKKNWLSVLILFPIICILTFSYIYAFKFTMAHFPLLLVCALFCLAQVIIYALVFTDDIPKKLVLLLLPLVVYAGMQLYSPAIDINASNPLPDNPVLTENATVETTSDDITITIDSTGEDSMIRIQTNKLGTYDFSITDGDKKYNYSVDISQNDGGSTQIIISPKQ